MASRSTLVHSAAQLLTSKPAAESAVRRMPEAAALAKAATWCDMSWLGGAIEATQDVTMSMYCCITGYPANRNPFPRLLRYFMTFTWFCVNTPSIWGIWGSATLPVLEIKEIHPTKIASLLRPALAWQSSSTTLSRWNVGAWWGRQLDVLWCVQPEGTRRSNKSCKSCRVPHVNAEECRSLPTMSTHPSNLLNIFKSPEYRSDLCISLLFESWCIPWFQDIPSVQQSTMALQ